MFKKIKTTTIILLITLLPAFCFASGKIAAIKKGQSLSQEEMRELVDKLFACAMPFTSPTGKKCFVTFELDELAKKFSI